MISNFPHLLDKPFSIEITPASTGDTLTTDPSDTMVIRIIDKNSDEKQKHLFYYGSQNSIDAEFKGKYIDILLWEKNISANKITLSIFFKLISHDMFVELFAISASNKLERRMILKDLNLAKNLFRERIDLFYPAKLNFLIISLNNNNNNNYKLVEPNTRLTCIVKDGYPAPEITWQLISGPRNASMYYSIISNGSQLYIKSNSPIKSSWTFKCSVKGYSMITERIISFRIAVHPSKLYVEPEIKKWLQSNSTISCYIKDENLNPEIKWQLVEGPPNSSLYYNILNNGSKIYMNTNNLPGTIWTFRCDVKIVITTTKIIDKTISFVVAKNFMENCDVKCINTKLLELEDSVERNRKKHQEQIELESNRTGLLAVILYGFQLKKFPVLLSLGKPTNQSSNYISYGNVMPSNYANDGNYSQSSYRHCSHTQYDTNAFWIVDLQKYHAISHVVIYNRKDCCQLRLVGAIIEVLSRKDTIIDECGRISDIDNMYTIDCFSIVGRKIRIRFDRIGYLTLCEVEVFGFV